LPGAKLTWKNFGHGLSPLAMATGKSMADILNGPRQARGRDRPHVALASPTITRMGQTAGSPESTTYGSPVDAYDHWHAQLEGVAEADDPWHQLVRRHLGSIEGASVLEIGCGRGGFARWLSQHGAQTLLAADFSPTAVAIAAKAVAGLPCQLEVADIGCLPHSDNRFDIVISCETIEHVPDPQGAVAELARVMRPGGRLLLTTPNYMSTMGLYRAYRHIVGRPFRESGQPINNLTLLPRTMYWLRHAGLRPTFADAKGHYLFFPHRRPIPIPLLDRAGRWVGTLAHHQLIAATKNA
jgi:SAM-dependent methyltransferase